MKAAKVLLFLMLTVAFIIPTDCLAQNKFRIGVVAPLTGTAASSGETIKNSVLLASKHFNQNHKVEFLFEDDQLSPKETVKAVNKLIKVDRVAALIVFGTPTSLAVNMIAEAHKVPMIALSIHDQVVKGKQFVFKHWVSAEKENEKIISEAKKRAYQRVAVVATVNDAMLKLRDLFAQNTKNLLVANEECNRDELDFKPIIMRLLQAKPDAIYLLLWSPQPGLFAKQLRLAGFKGDLFGVHNLEDPKEIAISAGALTGAWIATGDDQHAQKYYESYLDTYGSLPSAGGINAYDVSKILIEGSHSQELHAYLKTLKDFSGAYGTYDATGQNDFNIPATIKTLKAK
jgi:branched-chain amino acid transport system substrate-binding protein